MRNQKNAEEQGDDDDDENYMGSTAYVWYVTKLQIKAQQKLSY